MRRERRKITEEDWAKVHEAVDLVLDAMENGTEHYADIELMADRDPGRSKIIFRGMEDGFDMEKDYGYLDFFDPADPGSCGRMLAHARGLLGTKKESPATRQSKRGKTK